MLLIGWLMGRLLWGCRLMWRLLLALFLPPCLFPGLPPNPFPNLPPGLFLGLPPGLLLRELSGLRQFAPGSVQ